MMIEGLEPADAEEDEVGGEEAAEKSEDEPEEPEEGEKETGGEEM